MAALRSVRAAVLRRCYDACGRLLIRELSVLFAASRGLREQVQVALMAPAGVQADASPSWGWRSSCTAPPVEHDVVFKGMQSWEEVQTAVEGLGDAMSVMHVDAVFNALKTMRRRPPDSFLNRMARVSTHLAPSFRSRCIASVFHSCAKMRFSCSSLFEAMAREALLPSKLAGFNVQQLANTIYALGVLQKHHEVATEGQGGGANRACPSFYHKQRSQDGWGREDGYWYSPKDSRYGGPIFPSQLELLEALAGQIISSGCESTMTNQHICNIVYGLALAHVRHNALLNLLAREMTRSERVDEFSEQEFAMIIYSLGILKFQHKSVVPAMMVRLSQPGRMQAFSEQGLANMVLGLGLLCKVGVRLSDAVLSRVGYEITKPPRLSHFRDQHLSNMLYAFGLMQYRSLNVFEALVSEVVSRLTPQRFYPQAWSNIIYGIGRAKYPIPQATLDEMMEEVTRGEMRDQFTEQGLANILLSMGKLTGTYGLEADLEDLIAECIKDKRLHRFSALQLSSILYGLGLMNYGREDVVRILARRIVSPELVGELTEQGIATVVYALGRMEFRDEDVHLTLAGVVLTGGRLAKLSNLALSSIVYSWGKLKLQRECVLVPFSEEAQREERLDAASEHCLSNLMLGLFQMGLRERAVFKKFLSRLTKPPHEGSFRWNTSPAWLLELLDADMADVESTKWLREQLRDTVVKLKERRLGLGPLSRDGSRE
eukprot:evm.model.scf_3925.1 EVM.evm.TU.scf_3925.1   scf_3925:1691-4469(+)